MTVLPASRERATALWRARSLAACSAMRRPPIIIYLRNNSTRQPQGVHHPRGPLLQSTPCTPNPGSLIMLQDPQGRR